MSEEGRRHEEAEEIKLIIFNIVGKAPDFWKGERKYQKDENRLCDGKVDQKKAGRLPWWCSE